MESSYEIARTYVTSAGGVAFRQRQGSVRLNTALGIVRSVDERTDSLDPA